jgi:hypothetical protein
MSCNTDRNLNVIFVYRGFLVGACYNKFRRCVCSCSARSISALFTLWLVASPSAGCSSNILGQSFSASAVEDGEMSADAGLRTVISARKQSQAGFTSEDASGYLKRSSASGEPLRYRQSAKGAKQVPDDGPAAPSAGGSVSYPQTPAAAAPSGKSPQPLFASELYSVRQEEHVVVEVRRRGLDTAKPYTARVMFNRPSCNWANTKTDKQVGGSKRMAAPLAPLSSRSRRLTAVAGMY